MSEVQSVKISQLDTATELNLSDEFPLNNGGQTKKSTLQKVKETIGFADHEADSSIHHVIDDASSAADKLWSSEKIAVELSNKASATHNHDVSDITGVLPVTKGGTGLNVLSAGVLLFTTAANTVGQCTPGTGLQFSGNNLNVVPNTTNQRVNVMIDGVNVGTRKTVNLINNGGVLMSAVDNTGQDRVDVSVTATANAYASVRQTVLMGALDGNNLPACLSVGTGLVPQLLATATPVRLTFANGFGVNGQVDSIETFSANTNFPAVIPNTTSFLYAERITAGSLVLSHTLFAPQYGPAFDPTGLSINNFNGTNGATSFTDQYSGVTWTTGGTAALTTTAPKFGTACLKCIGNGDYAQTTSVKATGTKWTLDFWLKFDSIAANNQILGTPEIYSIGLRRNNTSNKLELYLSSNGSSYNIANGLAGTKADFTAGGYYHIALVFDGSTYKLWINGTLDISVTSALTLNGTGIRLGDSTANTDAINCSFDSFRFVDGVALFTDTFTPPTTAPVEMYHWFDTQAMQMKYGGPNDGWTVKDRVFIGEALAGASSISSVIAYAYRGVAKVSQSPLTGLNGVNTLKTHNLGLRNYRVEWEFVMLESTAGYAPGDIVTPDMVGNSNPYGIAIANESRNQLSFTAGAQSTLGALPNKTSGSLTSMNLSSVGINIYATRRF